MQMRHFDMWLKYNLDLRLKIIALVVNTRRLMKREQGLGGTCSRTNMRQVETLLWCFYFDFKDCQKTYAIKTK